MALKVGSSAKAKPLPPEAVHAAIMKEIKQVGDSKFRWEFSFEHEGNPTVAEKIDPAKWAPGSALFKTAQVLHGKAFSQAEVESFDLEKLKNKECKILTTNQRTAGGKMKTVVVAVMPKEG